ncbi:MAG TPA: HAD family phosphatase [Phenylobacterium sp.]
MSLPREVRAVVFDMDGLLCETESVYRAARLAVAAERGHAMPASLLDALIGLTGQASIQCMLDHLGEDFPAVEFKARVAATVVATGETGVPLKPGVVELLDDLDRLALPRAIATSSSPLAVEARLGHSGIMPRFDAVIARGDYERAKPHPDPFLRAAERLGVEPLHCLALEDSYSGVRAAAAAGMMTVMVPDLLGATDEMLGLCCGVVRDLHEVRAWLGPAQRP